MTAGQHTITEVLARIRELAVPTPAEEVTVAAALGRHLRQAATATIDLPPFASSAMDGFAVRTADTPGSLPVVERIPAGRPAKAPLRPGTAMAIATGGVLPEGADAVVPLELAEDLGDVVQVPVAPAVGANVRPRGGDVGVGAVVLAAGIEVTAGRLAALLAAGVGSVSCGRKPRAVVLTTGDELRKPGESLGPGQITETNGAMIAAALGRTGTEVELIGPVPDDLDAHRAALGTGLAADLLVTSGGVSVGPHDLVRRALAELGATEVLWGVAVRPGRPLWLGTRDTTLVFGLPGNPVSSLVGLELFVRPAARMLSGAADPGPHFFRGRLLEPLARDAERDVLYRARVEFDEEGPSLRPLSGQESHMIARAAVADALVYVERGEGPVRAGSSARFLRLD